MNYELQTETTTCLSFSIFAHTREGLTLAFERIQELRNAGNLLFASIVSSRDGEVYSIENRN